MIQDKNDILTWLKNFLIHGDFENAPDDFDIFDKIEKSPEEKMPKDKGGKDTGGNGGGGIRPPIGITPPISPQKPIDDVINFGNEDDFLKLLRSTLQDIRDFNNEADNSFKKFNDKLDSKNYQL